MLDQQVRQYPSLIHVFSTGNSGTTNCGYGAGSLWGNITGGHKSGKNVIAVANLDYADALATSSSRGPATDGRIKPDLAAKGTSVYSTVDPNDYALKSGTSMACPGVAGTMASLFQAYRDLYGGDDPMAGLMKGILLNTAEDLGNPGPDFKFGWGRINALRAVQVLETGRFDSATLSQGSLVTQSIDVPTGVAQLRVMIYWTDYEANVNTTWALVNNLDLTLTDPSNTVWLPWKLSHYPHPDSLGMPAFRGIDDRNNMEQVTLDNPSAGTYEIRITGTSVPQGPQTCYIIWEFIPAEITLTYPLGGEPMVPGETETIRWDASDETLTFTLEYSLNNGQSWDTLTTDIAGSQRHFNWTVPPAATGQALVRISDGVSASQSEATFTILGLPCNITADWVCSDALHLSWSPVPGAEGYEVMALGDTYMETVGVTSKTTFLYEAPGISSGTWMTVRATGQDGATGRRAYAVEIPAGLSGCFPYDAQLSGIPTAGWGLFPSELTTSPIPITIVVHNQGTQPISDPALAYQVNSGSPVSETWSGTIEPDSSLTFTFQVPVDLSQAGSYTLKAWIDWVPDQNPGNNMLEIPVEVTETISVTPGYLQNFDSWTLCASAPICELYTCNLEEGWTNLANSVYDMHDWRTYAGNTATSGTGPTTDHTTGTSMGHYLYVEPSLFCFNKEALILTPCLDLTTASSPVAHFWVHAWGADIGWLHTDLFDGTSIITDIISPVEGNLKDEWLEQEIDLSEWAGKNIQLRFRGITACDQKGDLAIDDFSLTDITSAEQPISQKYRLQVYPNPASGEVTLLVPQTDESLFILQVTDLFGRSVIPPSTISASGRVNHKLNLSSLPAGMYMIQLTGERVSYREKIVVK